MQDRMKCDYKGCQKTYCSSFNLKRHIDSFHKGVRKFRCDTCGKFLSSKQNYVDHQNTHTGEKPYVCQALGCHSTFRQLSQFYIHNQMHENIRNLLKPNNDPQDEMLSFLGRKLTETVILPEQEVERKTNKKFVKASGNKAGVWPGCLEEKFEVDE